MNSGNPPFDREKFLLQFQGMEDLAQDAVGSFLQSLPQMIGAVEKAILDKNSMQLEIAAHSLKGAVSNFFAEPSQLRAWQLEQMGHTKIFDKAEIIFSELRAELDQLVFCLSKLKVDVNE